MLVTQAKLLINKGSQYIGDKSKAVDGQSKLLRLFLFWNPHQLADLSLMTLLLLQCKRACLQARGGGASCNGKLFKKGVAFSGLRYIHVKG